MFSCCGNSDRNDRVPERPEVDSNVKVDKERKAKFGNYVYMDRVHCLHIRQDCLSLLIVDNNDNISEMYALHRIETQKLALDDLRFCCKDCINDSTYEGLRRIASCNTHY